MTSVKRMHVALNCSDLDKSLSFYRSFFGAEPTKVKENYEKFELDNPALHFSLNVRPFEKQGVLNHLGFQVDNTEDVLAMGERLRQANLLLISHETKTPHFTSEFKLFMFTFLFFRSMFLSADPSHYRLTYTFPFLNNVFPIWGSTKSYSLMRKVFVGNGTMFLTQIGNGIKFLTPANDKNLIP